MNSGNWRDRLAERYPFLFGQNGAAGASSRTYAFVGDGWRDLLEVLAERIDARAPRGSFRIDRIEEKYGSLVVSIQRVASVLDNDVLLTVDEAVALAEARSACTCQICGAEGVLHDRNGWLTTLCAKHAQGEVVAVRPGWEGVELVMIVQGGHLRLSRARRYDRILDAFVDVDLSVLEGDE